MKIELKNVSKTRGAQEVLSDISLTIKEGSTVAFLGPSGGGKSTLLRVIAGLEVPDSGEIFFNNTPLHYDQKSQIMHRRSLGIVFQSYNLFPHMSALENICFPLVEVHGMSKTEAVEIAQELLQRFNLASHQNKKPSELSGGQCQRIAILRAVAIKPKLMLFDEPTSALDPLMTAEVLDLIAELKSEGRHFILVSHHLSFVKKVAGTIVFIDKGRVIETSSATDFFSSPKAEEVVDYLGKGIKY